MDMPLRYCFQDILMSLMLTLNINMPAGYGESENNIVRLRLLEDPIPYPLVVTISVSWNPTGSFSDASCI